MQSEFMMIDPNELVIDLPTDEANVELKMRSMQANGLVQPIVVWLQGMRIIDGFHRVVAAQRSGWKGMACHVIDCSEEAFWDARIQSAKQHQTVEDDRLAAWMFESWRQTKWYSREDVILSRPQNPKIPSSALGMVKTVWEALDFLGIDLEDDELSEWMTRKAQMWGISTPEMANKLMAWCGLSNAGIEGRASGLAKMHNLSFEQRDVVALNLTGDAARWIEDYSENWVKDEIAPGTIKVKPFREYAREQEAIRVAEWEKKNRLEREKRNAYLQTPAGQAETTRRKFLQLKEGVERALLALSGVRHFMPDVPETPLLLSQHIEAVREMCLEFYPDSVKETEANPIWMENLELRQRLAEQSERIASLERALGSKVNQNELRNVLALSSVEIDLSQ